MPHQQLRRATCSHFNSEPHSRIKAKGPTSSAGVEAWRAWRDLTQDVLLRRAACTAQMPSVEERRRGFKVAAELRLYGAHCGFC
jgi:hypothetical protein